MPYMPRPCLARMLLFPLSVLCHVPAEGSHTLQPPPHSHKEAAQLNPSCMQCAPKMFIPRGIRILVKPQSGKLAGTVTKHAAMRDVCVFPVTKWESNVTDALQREA